MVPSFCSRRFFLRASLPLAAGILVLHGSARAVTTQTWIGTSGSGGAGTWSVNGDWNPSTWGTGNTAIFGATAGTVTVGTQTAGGLTFNVNGYSLVSGTLNLNTGTVITTATPGTTATFASTLSLAGAAGVALTKTGSGTLSLATQNTGLGTTASPAVWTVTGGVFANNTFDSVLSVNLGNNLGATPTAAGTQVILDAGTLQLRGAGSPAIGATRSFQVNTTGGAISDASGGNNSYQNNIADNAGSSSALYLSNTGGIATFSGVISGNGGVTWSGTGTLLLSGANTYLGGTTINAGTIQFNTMNSLGGAASPVNLQGGTLASTQTAAVTMTRIIATGTTGGTIQLNNGLPSAATSKITLGTAGQFTGSGPITLTNNGVLSIGAANTGYSGKWTLNGGVLELTNGSAAGTGGITVNSGAELSTLGSQINNALTLNGGSIAWDYYSNSGNYQGPVTLQFGGGTVSLANFYGTGAINGTISGNITGAGGLATSDSGPSGVTSGGILTLTGNNNYTGGTTVGVGTTLTVGNNTALGAANNPLTVAGTLNFNGYSPSVGALTLVGGSLFNHTFGAGGVEQLTVGSASVSGTNYFAFNPSALTGAGTYNLLTTASGSLTGTFGFSGADNLTVPVNSIIALTGSGSFYRLTLNNTGTSEQVVVTNDAPAKVFTIMPFGSSITAGQSNQNPYNGGGYRQQLYQTLVNDGRFTPNFVGSSTTLLATNPTSGNILTSANQLHHEGHPGWTTLQMLANLNLFNGDSGANGGYWLQPGNGENPNDITVNIGGNDAVDYGTSAAIMAAASQRLDATISEFNTLRPGVNTILSSICYRGDNATSPGIYSIQGLDPYYNPAMNGIVFNHVLAGQTVGFLDLRNIINFSTDTSSDNIHPTQAGYDKMANAWYQSVAYGEAFWTGAQDTVWNTVNGTSTNWAMDPALSTDRRKSLIDPATTTVFIYPDVFFSGNTAPLATTLGADTTVRSLNFTAGATGPVTVGAGNTLTIGGIDTSSGSGTLYTLTNAGGITVQAGTGAHTVASDIVLGADQTWGNVSSNDLKVSGGISGAHNLGFVGAYTLYNPGAYTPDGTDYKDATFTTVPATAGGTGGFILSGMDTHSGNTALSSNAKLTVNGSLSATASVSVDASSTLVVNGSVNASAGVALNGALGGIGTVGAVTAASGAVIAPGNAGVGTLTVSSVTLPIGAALNIACGASAGSALVVSGDAHLNGTVNVTLLPGSRVTAFNRQIVSTGGALDITGLQIGTVPTGLSASDFSLTVNGGNLYLQYGATASGGPYALFQAAYFTAAQQADASISGPTADPDLDGIPNAVDYALGLNPISPGTGSPYVASLQSASATAGAPVVLALSFYVPENPPSEATLNVRQGSDLTTLSSWPIVASRNESGAWTTGNGGSVSQGTPVNGFVPVTVFGSLARGATQEAFLRLEVSVP